MKTDFHVRLSACALTALILTPLSSQAAVETWQGNVSAAWSGLNWTGTNPVPVAADTLVFGVAGSSGTALNNDLAANLAIGSATFNAGAPSYTINGNAINTGGTFLLNNSAVLQTVNLPLNFTSSPTVTGNGSVLLGGVLNEAATFGNRTLANSLTAGILTVSGGINLTTTGDTTARTWTFAGGATSKTLVSGVIADGGGTALSAIAASFTDPNGLLTLTAANTYTGRTTVTYGTLKLDFSATGAPASNIIATGKTLTVDGGTLNLTGLAGATNSQTMGAVTINTNKLSAIRVTQGGATAMNLVLAGLTRNAGSTIDFTLPTAGTITTTTTNNVGTNKILANSSSVAYGTVDGTTWATNTTGTIGALANGAYQAGDFTSATGDTDVTASFTNSAALLTTNTLRFNTPSTTLTLNSAGPSVVTSGGILVTSAGTGSEIASAGAGAGLTGRGAANSELVIENYGDLTISAPIQNNGINATALTLSGTGVTKLTGANTYTGLTTVSAGSLTVAAATTNAGGITLGALGATLNVNHASGLGAGTVTLTAGTLNNTSGAALTNAGNNGITLGGNINFGTVTSTSANNLNLGTGVVTATASRTITFLGQGTTLTTGALNNNSTTGNTFTANGVGNTWSLPGLTLSATSTAPVTSTLAGSAAMNVTGPILNGSAFANNLTVSSTGVVTTSGANTYTGITSVTSGNGIYSIAQQGSLYSGTAALWTPALISVNSAATLALGVGAGPTYFDAPAVDTFVDAAHMGLSTATTGFKTGALLGFDTTNASAGTFTYGSNLTNLGTSTTGVTKLGLGTLVLSGSATYGGATNVANGTLNVTGPQTAGGSLIVANMASASAAAPLNATYTLAGSGSYTGALGSNVTVGNVAYSIGTLNVGAGTSLTATAASVASGNGILTVGAVTNAVGVVNQTDGAVTADNFIVGTSANGLNTAYGFYNQSGGSFTNRNGASNARFRIGVPQANNVGLYYLSGGTSTYKTVLGTGSSTSIDLCTSGTPSTVGGNPVGVIYITGTGQMINENAAGSITISNTLNTTVASTATAQLTIGGAGSTTAGLTVSAVVTSSAVAGAGNQGNSIINLLPGGTLTTGNITKNNNGRSYLNFNGGTLKVGTTSTTLAATLNGVYSYAGGATVDTNGLSYTIAGPVLAPTGMGLSSIGIASGGAGYVGAPAVTITGGSGTGATAIANITGGSVTSIVITNPGTGYASGDTLTVALRGGGATTPATLAAVTAANFTTNISGGLTKSNGGTLRLSGTNTYSGNTTVTEGTLRLDASNVSNDTSTVSLGTSAILNLAFVGSDTVGQLVINSVPQAAGTYVASGTETGAEMGTPRITGTGKLIVTSSGGATYASWIAGYSVGGMTAATDDFDHDGLGNLVEHILGTDPSVPSAGLDFVSGSGNVLKFRHAQTNALAADVAKSYQWSTDLTAWKASGQSNAGGTTATISPATITDTVAPANDVIEVTVTVTSGPAGRIFCRLVGTKTP